MLAKEKISAGRILIVEEDDSLREVMSIALQKAGYEVITAADGVNGDAKAREVHPDLIVLGIMLPQKNGHEICVALKQSQDYRDIPIILMSVLTEVSSHSDEYWRDKTGADDYITKPFSVGELVWHVARLLASDKKERSTRHDDKTDFSI